MHKIFTYASAGTAATLAGLVSLEGGAMRIQDYTANPTVERTYGMSSEAQAEDDFERYMAATLDMSEPDAGTWEDIKAKLGL